MNQSADQVSTSRHESAILSADAARERVWQAIRAVTDPELDESIVDLGFIQSLSVIPARSMRNRFDVHLTFRLPTYWCAANFAFIMAEDMRERIARLPWINHVVVEIADHFTADEINRGLEAGKSFSESFPEEGGGDLKDLRRLFRLKAFQRRQYGLLRYLIDTLGAATHARSEILAMTIGQLRDLSITAGEGDKLRLAYLEILHEFTRGGHSYDDSAPAFIFPNGQPLDLADLDDYLRQLRRTTTNIEFNSAVCSSLLKSRNRT